MKSKLSFLKNIFNILILFIIFFALFFNTSFAADITDNKNNNTNLNQSESSNFSESAIKNITDNAYGLFKEKIISNISETSEKYADNSEKNEKKELNISANSCILMECSTNRVAYEKNADEKVYPASTTKVLTAILTMEHCNLSDTVTITKEMISGIPSEYTSAHLRPGEQVTVEQLLNSLLIPSANDAGFALAVHISGSVENFANLMNEKATEIGCTNSHFTNPSGIHDENHYSTARDMALIGMYSLKYNEITDIGKKTSYSLHPTNSYERKFETTNNLLKPSQPTYYEYATGLKTGFTDPAGSCIIATAKKDNMEFLAVVLGAPAPGNTTQYRDTDCKTLFEYGFENYAEITKPDDIAISFINDYIYGGITLSSFIKIGITTIAIYLVYKIIKIKK